MNFPKLQLRNTNIKNRIINEKEKVIGEEVVTKTEQYIDESTGASNIRTVEYIEKIIEKEVSKLHSSVSTRLHFVGIILPL